MLESRPMETALQGALIGLALGAFLTAFEYLALKKAVDERAKRLNRKLQFEEMEKRRIKTVLRFALILPIAFAIGAVLIAKFFN
jgi:hypothetical protein